MSVTPLPRRRKLGPWMAIALVVGNMIGSGVFLLPASLAAFGSASLLAWVLTSTGALLLALVFARLGRAYPKTGGPYAYARRAFGDFVGFQTAWGYWIAVWVGNAAIAVAFVSYLGYFWPALTDTALLAAGVALAAIWLLTAVNVRGVRQGGWVQAVTTVAKLTPLVGLAVAAPFFIGAGRTVGRRARLGFQEGSARLAPRRALAPPSAGRGTAHHQRPPGRRQCRHRRRGRWGARY